MENICNTCPVEPQCDTQVSSVKLARYGACKSKNLELKKHYESLNDDDLIKVLESEKKYKDMVWFIEANKVYRSRFSKDYE